MSSTPSRAREKSGVSPKSPKSRSRVVSYGDELERVGNSVARLSLEHGVSISVVFQPEAEWRAGESMFLRNVRAEAVPA